MKKVALLLAFASATLCSAVHAAQVMGASCPEQNSGAFGETASHQGVVCANGKWQDATSLPMVSMLFSKVNAKAKSVDGTFGGSQFIGVRRIQQTSDGHGQFTLVATVVALNADNTAHVVVDLDDAGWQKHVDTTVPLDTSTAIATDNDGKEYRVKVARIRS